MEETKELITTDDIRSKVYIIRGQQVKNKIYRLNRAVSTEELDSFLGSDF